jgi:hypothetical protein
MSSKTVDGRAMVTLSDAIHDRADDMGKFGFGGRRWMSTV